MITDALRSFLPDQLLQDIAESEDSLIDEQQEQEYMLRLVVFLNDFGHLCVQYIYGVDHQLKHEQQLSNAGAAELRRQRQWAEDANDYVQLFCKILGEAQIVKGRTLLFITRKYIPCALVDDHSNVSEVLDRLQDKLMLSLPAVKNAGERFRLSNLWRQLRDACGGLIDAADMDDLWVKLCKTVQYAHT